MATYYDKRKGPDGLQKVFLYLIVLDWVILFFVTIEVNNTTFRHGVLSSIMLTSFNLILMNICFRRARRSGDSYMLYPVITGALYSFTLMSYFFFFL